MEVPCGSCGERCSIEAGSARCPRCGTDIAAALPGSDSSGLIDMASIARAFRNSTPARAARPVATMIEIGVARPSAHGHAMMSTETAAITACAGSRAKTSQARNAIAAIAITAGTNQPETRSASAWIGARLRCASATSRTMRASSVSWPTRRASMTRPPDPFTVAPTTPVEAPSSAPTIVTA